MTEAKRPSGLTKTQFIESCERAFTQTYLEKFEANGGAIDEADASDWFYLGWEAGFRYRAQMFNVKDKK